MPRAKTNKFYRTFSKGLITEAGYLTYPEDASSDELNTILSRKGNRSRRLGADLEAGAVLNSLSANADHVTHEFVWKAVNNDPNVAFTCVQLGAKIHFFRMDEINLSSRREPFTVDLINYKIPSSPSNEFPKEYCDMSAGSGYLFVAHRFMDPVSVEYKPETNSLVVVPIVIQVRDFEGVYDTLANDDEPSSLSAQHHYNLLNQGWVTPGTKAVDISTPTYPGSGGGLEPGAEPPPPSDPNAPPEGPAYYDPYTGETTFHDPSGYGGRNQPQ